MNKLTLVLLALALAAGASSAQYHDPVYLMGGYGSSSTTSWNGVWLADAQKQTLTHLTPNQRLYYTYTIQMDADNRRVVLAVGGTTSTSTVYKNYLRSGVYRLDPATFSITTVLADSMKLYYPRRLVVNSDGDYVIATQSFRRVGSRNYYDYQVLKLTGAGATLSTILTTVQLGARSYFYGLGTNMDTGHTLLNLYSWPSLYYAVLDLADDGSYTTFAGGASPSYGWYGYYDNMYQNFDNAALEAQTYGLLYQLMPGAQTRTTLWNLGYPGNFYPRSCSKFDIQSARAKRIVSEGYAYMWKNNSYYYAPSVFYIDPRPPYTVTAVNCDPRMSMTTRYNYGYGFDFYRGRHVQSVKLAPGRWDVRISCPRYPGKSYVMALSLRGYRPAVPLPDGRRLYLVPDDLSVLSVANRMQPFFDAGPLKLDARGEATATIDLSLFGKKLNVPLWVAVAILDPKAPLGIAYLPDTYVMRI